MTPKEKCDQLINYFLSIGINDRIIVKKCGLAAVKSMLSVYKDLSEDDDIMFPKEILYLEEVKQEIEAL